MLAQLRPSGAPANLCAPSSSSRLGSVRTCRILRQTPVYGNTVLRLPQLYPGTSFTGLQPQHTNGPWSRRVVTYSFLGVGAPEALLVAVVALVVFGPKGLADAAKSLGGALRSFQPTIREVVEVSQELKSTLETELGLDELRKPMVPTPRPRSPAPEATSTSGSTPLQPVTEDLARVLDPDIEAKRAAAAQAAWSAQTQSPMAATPASAPAATPEAAPPSAPAPAPVQATQSTAAVAQKDVGAMSIEELEAELARRRHSA